MGTRRNLVLNAFRSQHIADQLGVAQGLLVRVVVGVHLRGVGLAVTFQILDQRNPVQTLAAGVLLGANVRRFKGVARKSLADRLVVQQQLAQHFAAPVHRHLGPDKSHAAEQGVELKTHRHRSRCAHLLQNRRQRDVVVQHDQHVVLLRKRLQNGRNKGQVVARGCDVRPVVGDQVGIFSFSVSGHQHAFGVGVVEDVRQRSQDVVFKLCVVAISNQIGHCCSP